MACSGLAAERLARTASGPDPAFRSNSRHHSPGAVAARVASSGRPTCTTSPKAAAPFISATIPHANRYSKTLFRYSIGGLPVETINDK